MKCYKNCIDWSCLSWMSGKHYLNFSGTRHALKNMNSKPVSSQCNYITEILRNHLTWDHQAGLDTEDVKEENSVPGKSIYSETLILGYFPNIYLIHLYKVLGNYWVVCLLVCHIRETEIHAKLNTMLLAAEVTSKSYASRNSLLPAQNRF